METTVINATEYRDLPLSLLTESKTNPRHVFDLTALNELAAFVRRECFRRSWFAGSPRTVSRSSPGRGVTAPHRWPKLPPCRRGSSISRTPKSWSHNSSRT